MRPRHPPGGGLDFVPHANRAEELAYIAEPYGDLPEVGTLKGEGGEASVVGGHPAFRRREVFALSVSISGKIKQALLSC